MTGVDTTVKRKMLAEKKSAFVAFFALQCFKKKLLSFGDPFVHTWVIKYALNTHAVDSGHIPKYYAIP